MAVPFQEVQTHGLAIDRIDSLYVPDHLTANPETAAAVRAAIELCDVPSSRIFMMRTQP